MTEWFEWRDVPPAEFGVIGDPISHTWSPKMMAAAFAEMGLPFRFVAVRVPAAEFTEAIDHLKGSGFRGVNVTLPLKNLAFVWATKGDTYSDRYSMANVLDLVNCRSTNTDARGFLVTLHDAGVLAPAHVLMLGAGGSGQTLSIALVDAGYHVSIWNRTTAKALELAEMVGSGAQALHEADPADCSLIVNATASSLQHSELPIEWRHARQDVVAYDLLCAEEPTPFLKTAVDLGFRTMDGREMLVAQGALSLEWWLELKAPREAMRRALP